MKAMMSPTRFVSHRWGRVFEKNQSRHRPYGRAATIMTGITDQPRNQNLCGTHACNQQLAQSGYYREENNSCCGVNEVALH